MFPGECPMSFSSAWLTNGEDGCTIGYSFFGFLGDR
jgi:hypothetical protein